MGRMLEQFAPEYGFDVAAKIDAGESIEKAAGCDVAIEFSTPEAAAGNVGQLAALGVPVVCGTTGWLSKLPDVKAEVERRGGALVWSPNFSVGVTVFTRVVNEASRLLAN